MLAKVLLTQEELQRLQQSLDHIMRCCIPLNQHKPYRQLKEMLEVVEIDTYIK